MTDIQYNEFNVDEIARNERNENLDIKQRYINTIREWIIQQKNLNGCTGKQKKIMISLLKTVLLFLLQYIVASFYR